MIKRGGRPSALAVWSAVGQLEHNEFEASNNVPTRRDRRIGAY